MRRGLGVAAMVSLVVLAAIAGAVLVRGDGSPAESSAPPSTGAAGPATTALPLTPTSTTPVGASVEPITLAFGGDVHFEGSLRSRAIANPAGLLAPIAPVLSHADVAMVNLETAVTDRGPPVDKEFTFRAL